MKTVTFILIQLISPTVFGGWDVDPRCPAPKNKRMLEEEQGSFEEEDPFWDELDYEKALGDFPTKNSNTAFALRGTMNSTAATSRKLSLPKFFSIKMHWKLGYCWQEEYTRHRKWCWQCKGDCEENGELWFQKCNKKVDTQRFSYVPDVVGGRFKVYGKDLCLQRVSRNRYRLKKCNDRKSQIIMGFFADGSPFELQAFRDSSNCINQHHHPKAGEEVINTLCKTARYWHTNLMEIYNPNGYDDDSNQSNGNSAVGSGHLKIRKPACSLEEPCERCEGDCDVDMDCRGDLVCFQRGGVNKNANVPGCTGTAVSGRDYCVSMTPITNVPAPAPVPVDIVPIVRPVRNCSPNNPCKRCEGDCDIDSDCAGALKCFQKDGPGFIDGCKGMEMSKTDFCFAP